MRSACSASTLILRVGVLGDGAHVSHDLLRMRKDVAVDALKDELLLVGSRPENGPVGVVDIAGTATR